VTADEGKRRQLGRGLSALLGEESEDYAELDRLRLSKTVPVEFLQPSRFQPRHRFDDEEIRGLIDSIRANGILQPILVRRVPEQPDRFEIIAGERRWRAAQAAKLHEVPVIIKDLSDGDALEIALVENLQRQDLTPLEEAEAYRRLMEEFSHTQEDLARALGKSRSHIANTLRLLGLPEPVRTLLDEGKLTAGHGRALLAAVDPVRLAEQVVSKGLNVRQTESLAQGKKRTPRPAAHAEKDADTIALENEVSNLLGLKVAINHHPTGGTVTIRYQTLEQLDEILRRLSHVPHAARSARAPSSASAPPTTPASAGESAGRGTSPSVPPAAPASPPRQPDAGPPRDPSNRETGLALRVVGGTHGAPADYTAKTAPSVPTSAPEAPRHEADATPPREPDSATPAEEQAKPEASPSHMSD
jgi:ParB family chromosome partitioning protein